MRCHSSKGPLTAAAELVEDSRNTIINDAAVSPFITMLIL
jgi:hypothetical protein